LAKLTDKNTITPNRPTQDKMTWKDIEIELLPLNPAAPLISDRDWRSRRPTYISQNASNAPLPDILSEAASNKKNVPL
jgi:hypothetical protein